MVKFDVDPTPLARDVIIITVEYYLLVCNPTNNNDDYFFRYRERFMVELAQCSKDLTGPERRKCRQSVRKRYP